MPPSAASKQELRDLEKIRELLKQPANKTCFDCTAKSPFFVDMTVYTFICARCSGLVREAGHRIKSLSSSRFSPMERLLLELGGNEVAKGIWMHGYMKHHPELPELTSDMEVRQFMRQKYYEQRWLDREALQNHVDIVNREVYDKLSGEQDIGLKPSSAFDKAKMAVSSDTGSARAASPVNSSPTVPLNASKPLPTLPSASSNQDLLLIDLNETMTSSSSSTTSPLSSWIDTPTTPSTTYSIQPIMAPPSSNSASSTAFSSASLFDLTDAHDPFAAFASPVAAPQPKIAPFMQQQQQQQQQQHAFIAPPPVSSSPVHPKQPTLITPTSFASLSPSPSPVSATRPQQASPHPFLPPPPASASPIIKSMQPIQPPSSSPSPAVLAQHSATANGTVSLIDIDF